MTRIRRLLCLAALLPLPGLLWGCASPRPLPAALDAACADDATRELVGAMLLAADPEGRAESIRSVWERRKHTVTQEGAVPILGGDGAEFYRDSAGFEHYKYADGTVIAGTPERRWMAMVDGAVADISANIWSFPGRAMLFPAMFLQSAVPGSLRLEPETEYRNFQVLGLDDAAGRHIVFAVDPGTMLVAEIIIVPEGRTEYSGYVEFDGVVQPTLMLHEATAGELEWRFSVETIEMQFNVEPDPAWFIYPGEEE